MSEYKHTSALFLLITSIIMINMLKNYKQNNVNNDANKHLIKILFISGKKIVD